MRPEISRELSSNFPQLEEELRRDRAEAQRQVLLWQRWIRYAVVLGAALLIALFGAQITPGGWFALGVAFALYFVFHGLVAAYVSRIRRDRMRDGVQLLVLLADVAMLSALIYLSATPSQFHRILLLGFLVLQLTVFYFGRRQGYWAMLLVLFAYLVTSLAVPPYVPGPQPLPFVVLFNSGLFLAVALVHVFTFGGFRERMNHFRQACKRAELGDLAGSYTPDTTRWPDDLTLLGRSFNDMRVRLLEQIGTDPLTGCLNRRVMETRMNREWRRANRRDSTLAVLAVDVDFFKRINDTHGHPVGDLVLQELADIMRTTARDTDIVARFGGDEFVILLPDTGWEGARTFAERLRANVDGHGFAEGPAMVNLTVSVGMALARGRDPISVDDLLQAADRSLYRAKEGGRNRISD
ncbi:MAG: diguanylate cyclase [Gemmatimonadaceae bacterium]